MKRLHFATVLAVYLWASTGVAQNQQATERIERHKNIAQLMSSLHNWGVDLNVEQQLKQLGPKIVEDLEYAGSGGVLVVARMEKVQTDSGIYRRLIGDRLDYVGLGSSAVDAEISNISKSQLGRNLTAGSFLDADNSNGYWFSRSNDGEIVMREKPYSWLRRDVINEIADRKRRSYDWSASRTAELTRLAEALERKVGHDKLGETVTALLQSRNDALSKQAAINADLKRELARAQRANEGKQIINGLGLILDYASIINSMNLSPEQPNSSPMTKEQAEDRLNKIKNEADAKAAQLAKELETNEKSTLEFDMKLEWNLRDRHVPMDNLPPASSPSVNSSEGTPIP